MTVPALSKDDPTTRPMRPTFEAIRNLGTGVRLGLLTAAVLGLLLVVGPVAWAFRGLMGSLAAGIAAAACLAGAAPALAAGRWLGKPSQVVPNALIGTALRMGIPLGIGLAIHLHNGPLAKAGLLYYLLVFYPVTLGIETALTLPRSGRAAQRERKITDVTS